MEVGMPQVRSLVVVDKLSSTKAAPGEPTPTAAYYLSSHHPRRAGAKQFRCARRRHDRPVHPAALALRLRRDGTPY